MTKTDVKDLSSERLPAGKFPAEARSEFRLHIAPEVRRGIEQHAKTDVSIEICGVLVGNWFTDENGPYAVVTDYIRCDNASSKMAEVTFTHESWAQINKEMDSKFAEARIVGWYHSHPDFGIFLSERDCFIHEHFFSGAGQVAYVVDPVRGLEGMFIWRDGKPAPIPYFWVGNNIRTVEASQRNIGAEMAAHAAASGTNAPQTDALSSPMNSSLGLAATLLGLMALFYLGYLYGGWRSNWEQRMFTEGAVAHFADTKLIRIGLEQELAGVQSRLNLLSNELNKLPAPSAELPKEQLEEATNRRNAIHDNLVLCAQTLGGIEKTYGLSDDERGYIARIIALKQAELRARIEAAKQPKTATEPDNAKPKSDKAPLPEKSPPPISVPAAPKVATPDVKADPAAKPAESPAK